MPVPSGLVPKLVLHAGKAFGLGGEVYFAARGYIGWRVKAHAAVDVNHEGFDVGGTPVTGSYVALVQGVGGYGVAAALEVLHGKGVVCGVILRYPPAAVVVHPELVQGIAAVVGGSSGMALPSGG